MKGTLVEHLASRGYDVARYKTQWLTDTELTVPLFDFDGKLKGYQTYKPDAPKAAANPKDARYFTRGLGRQLVWGLELAVEYEINNQPIANRILN